MLCLTKLNFLKDSEEKIQCPKCCKHFAPNVSIEHLRKCCTEKS